MNYRPARPASFCLIYFSFISQISFGFVQGSGWNDFFFFFPVCTEHYFINSLRGLEYQSSG